MLNNTYYILRSRCPTKAARGFQFLHDLSSKALDKKTAIQDCDISQIQT